MELEKTWVEGNAVWVEIYEGKQKRKKKKTVLLAPLKGLQHGALETNKKKKGNVLKAYFFCIVPWR